MTDKTTAISRHDWFAGLALQAIVSKQPLYCTCGKCDGSKHVDKDEVLRQRERAVKGAVALADLMLAETQPRQ